MKTQLMKLLLILLLIICTNIIFCQQIIDSLKEESSKPNSEFQKNDTTTKSFKFNPKEISTFTFNTSVSTELSVEAIEYLDILSEFLKENPDEEIIIIGYSDNEGTYEENQRRSELRAQQVFRYLVNKGIARTRIFIRVRGSLDPIDSNDTEEGRRKNNRVKITVF